MRIPPSPSLSLFHPHVLSISFSRFNFLQKSMNSNFWCMDGGSGDQHGGRVHDHQHRECGGRWGQLRTNRSRNRAHGSVLIFRLKVFHPQDALQIFGANLQPLPKGWDPDEWLKFVVAWFHSVIWYWIDLYQNLKTICSYYCDRLIISLVIIIFIHCIAQLTFFFWEQNNMLSASFIF